MSARLVVASRAPKLQLISSLYSYLLPLPASPPFNLLPLPPPLALTHSLPLTLSHFLPLFRLLALPNVPPSLPLHVYTLDSSPPLQLRSLLLIFFFIFDHRNAFLLKFSRSSLLPIIFPSFFVSHCIFFISYYHCFFVFLCFFSFSTYFFSCLG